MRSKTLSASQFLSRVYKLPWITLSPYGANLVSVVKTVILIAKSSDLTKVGRICTHSHHTKNSSHV